MVVRAGRKVVTSESLLSSRDYDSCNDRIGTLKIRLDLVEINSDLRKIKRD